MDSDRVNRWLTLGANIGVLVGIGLLILEINQNSELMQVQIEQSRSETYVEWLRERASNDALSALDAKIQGLGGPAPEVWEQLTPIEQSRVRAMLAARFYDYENLYYQYKRGFVSEQYWQDRAVPVIRNMAPLWKHIWGAEPLAARREFELEIESILADRAETP